MTKQEALDAFISTTLSSETPFVQLDTPFRLQEVMAAFEDQGVFVSQIDRAAVFNKDTLLHALYQACVFPAYFGFNWDALEDMLTDFSWIFADAYVLLFADFGLLKERDAKTAELFESIIQDVAMKREENGLKPLRVVLL